MGGTRGENQWGAAPARAAEGRAGARRRPSPERRRRRRRRPLPSAPPRWLSECGRGRGGPSLGTAASGGGGSAETGSWWWESRAGCPRLTGKALETGVGGGGGSRRCAADGLRGRPESFLVSRLRRVVFCKTEFFDGLVWEWRVIPCGPRLAGSAVCPGGRRGWGRRGRVGFSPSRGSAPAEGPSRRLTEKLFDKIRERSVLESWP